MAKAKESPAPEPFLAPAVPPDGPGRPTAPEGTQPPPFGSPIVAEVKGEFPRECVQNVRVPAGSGLSRFKIRAKNYDGLNKPRYILAPKGDREAAKKCYLDVSGINGHMAQLRESGLSEKDIAGVLWSVVELAD